MNGAIGAVSGARLWFFSADRKKDLKAEFERVAVPQLSHLYTSAFYLTKDKTESEDLVQETYLRAFRFFDKFQSGTNCKAWLLTHGNNTAPAIGRSILSTRKASSVTRESGKVVTLRWNPSSNAY